MSWIAGSSSEVAMRGYRRRFVPVLSTLAACLLALLPFVPSVPLIPDWGFLVLLAWRLLRPEIWSAQAALPLGLFNDLVSGAPIGQSMALWTVTFLMIELIDSRLGFRDYWMDWVIAAILIILYTSAVWYIALLMGSPTAYSTMLPQIGLSILAYPLVARIVLALDTWRLAQ